ncbi:MAG TPA: PQQ-dependent sugar dehydrogenase [Candidatus Limnocylindria bacterium]|jgi:glucose/arabinose dehydrogenase
MGSARTLRHLAAVLACLAALAVGMGACSAASPSTVPSAAASSSASVPAAASPSPAASSHPPSADPDAIHLDEVASGLADPIGITNAGDGSGRLFVNERGGVVRVIDRDGSLRQQPFVDLSDRVEAGSERGLLGLAFHPHFADNRRLFVHYSRAGDGATVVSELHAAADGKTADPSSERVLLTVAQPFANHNGGQLAFGPDGYLYLGLGDGGSGGDPFGNGQNPDVLLGKILRLDVDGPHAARRGYGLPPDNAFGPDGPRPGQGAPEIWALGLRNPWRFSFDAQRGDLYIGDVGQNAWEEIDRQPAGARAGRNYGWNQTEGLHCYTDGCDRTRFVDPIAEYGHDAGCSVTGGYVYRGALQPGLRGVYLFGDYCSGTVWSLQVDSHRYQPRTVLHSDLAISSFGAGEDGELFVADIAGGAVYHVVAGH